MLRDVFPAPTDADELASLADADLVLRSVAGQREAFSALASHHKSWLFRFIRRYVGNDADALDLLQDTMVAAWLALGRYDVARPFEAWLRRIALNKCRDWSRRTVLRRVVTYLTGDTEDAAVDVRSADPETACIADELLGRLDRAVAALPRGLREPFILTAFEGLSTREAAAMLSLTEKAVEGRIYRARRQLATVVARADLQLLVQVTAT